MFDLEPRKVPLGSRRKEEPNQTQRENPIHSVILHIPHASTNIPSNVKNQFLLSEDELQLEQLKMVDMYTDELFYDKDFPRIVSGVSRLVCDMERFADNEQEPMSRVGMGVIYEKTHDGKQLRRKLKDYETRDLLRQYYQLNGQYVESAVRDAVQENGYAVIIDCHSFPSIPHPFEMDQAVPRPDICIGTDAYHTPDELLQLVRLYFTDEGYSVAVNSPYEGTYVPLADYRCNRNVLSIMIEVNRSLYMDQATGEKLPCFEIVHTQLVMLLEGVKRFMQEWVAMARS